MEQLLQVGVITQPHGVRGEVKVFPTTDDPVRFKKLKKVILDTGKEKLDLEVEHVKFFKQFVIVKFKEFDNINIDLMIGLPNQKILDIKKSLEEIIKLNPNHVSVYSLILEEGTVLYKKVENKKFKR